MNKEITEYLNIVCAQIKSRQARLSARSELSGHIRTAADELIKAGSSEEEAVKVSLSRMGDPQDIGKQIAYYNSPLRNSLPALSGFALLIGVFAWIMPSREYLFDQSALTFVVLLTLGLVMTGGLSRLTKLSAFARGRTAALYAGGIGMLIGVMETLSNISDLERIGVNLSFCITSVLYGLITSALLTSAAHLYRPLDGNEVRKILELDDSQ